MKVSYSFSDQEIPDNSEVHLWADYIELVCLSTIDNQISQEDILDRIRERQEDLGEGDKSEDMSENSDGSELSAAEINDKWSLKVEDWFTQLKYRHGAFGTTYPFVFDHHDEMIRLKKRLTNNHRLYIFLLMCSSLRFFNKSNQNHIAASFEFSSYKAIQKFIPNGKSFMFGKHKLNKHKFTGHAFDKIKVLANEIYEDITCEKGDFEVHDNGDKGLDIVGWIPFTDEASGLPLFFCQCACGKDWNKKQHEASKDNFNYMTYTMGPAVLTFIPYCYRSSHGDWYKKAKIKSIVIDRVRICELLKGHYSEIESYVDEFVNEIIDYEEDIF